MFKLRAIIVGLFLGFVIPGYAQHSIVKFKADSVKTELRRDSVRVPAKLDINYYSEALERAKRRALRKEHNLVKIDCGLGISQAGFVNWAKGGDNTFAGRFTLDISHSYKHEKLTIDTRLTSRYGINIIEKKTFKNEDEFRFTTQMMWKMYRNWAYSGKIGVRSQFSKGYRSRTDKTLRSNFMAPGFVDLAFGFNYKKPKSPFNVTISPATGNMITVLDDNLLHLGLNGVEKGKHTKSQIGSSFEVNFDKEFYNKVFRYKSDFLTFYNYNLAPTLRWENTFSIRATKFLETKIYCLLLYDEAALTPKPNRHFQVNYNLSLVLSFQYRNRK